MAAETTSTDRPAVSLARHRVRDGIEALILRGQYKGGDRLTQQELAKHFGVAQSVIREALLQLQFSGLVRTVDRLGVFVSDLDTRHLLEAYEVREMLEALAARRCCDHASRADLAQLKDVAHAIHRVHVDGDYPRRGALDREFHARIIDMAHNSMLLRLREGYRTLGMAVQAQRDNDHILTEHMAIIEAIENNSPDEAERAAREHVRGARQALEQRIEDEGFKLDWVVPDPSGSTS